MHFEEPQHPPSGLKQFAQQYAMIVLSILTALALERLAVTWNNHASAQSSRTRIEAELKQNLADLKQSQTINAQNVASARKVEKALFQMVKAGKPNDTTMLQAAQPILTLVSVSTPSWQRTAWESALSDQSAAHLAPPDLRRYAEIYEAEKELEDTTHLLLAGDWLTGFTDAMVDFQLGQIDGHKVAALLARYLLAEQQIDRSQQDLITLITTGHPPDTEPAAR